MMKWLIFSISSAALLLVGAAMIHLPMSQSKGMDEMAYTTEAVDDEEQLFMKERSLVDNNQTLRVRTRNRDRNINRNQNRDRNRQEKRDRNRNSVCTSFGSSCDPSESACCQGGCSVTTQTCFCQANGGVCFNQGRRDSFCCSNRCGDDGKCTCIAEGKSCAVGDGFCCGELTCDSGTCKSTDPLALLPTLRETPNPSLNSTTYPHVTPSEHKPLSFFAIGDVPYSNLEACLLPYELDKAANSGADAKFMLHLGDIRDGKPYESGRPRPCPEYMYEDVATIFESSSVPTFFMVGDNGWLDCADADESYTFWKKHLLAFYDRTDLGWPELGATVKHSEDHAEFFAFVMQDVLIVGQGLPGKGKGGRDHTWNDWNAYLDANVDWTRKAFAENSFKAVVVCGNSSLQHSKRYFTMLERIAKQYSDVPILFLGDEHDFQEEFGFRGLPNMHRIALDDVVTPTLITVDPYATGGTQNVFKYDRRCPCAGNHRPTELFSYSTGRCAGVCDTNKYCLNEDAESVLWGEV